MASSLVQLMIEIYEFHKSNYSYLQVLYSLFLFLTHIWNTLLCSFISKISTHTSVEHPSHELQILFQYKSPSTVLCQTKSILD